MLCGMVRFVGRLLLGLCGFTVWVGCGMCPKWLGPREQSPPSKDPGIHLSGWGLEKTSVVMEAIQSRALKLGTQTLISPLFILKILWKKFIWLNQAQNQQVYFLSCILFFHFYFFGFALITHINICHTSQMHSECTNQTKLSMNVYYLYSTFTWRVLASSWEGEYSIFVLL